MLELAGVYFDRLAHRLHEFLRRNQLWDLEKATLFRFFALFSSWRSIMIRHWYISTAASTRLWRPKIEIVRPIARDSEALTRWLDLVRLLRRK